jgi:hypothetical protein
VAAGVSRGLGAVLHDRTPRDDPSRAHASGIKIRSLCQVLLWFSSAVPLENVHPLQAGIFRLKRWSERRSGMPLESRLSFYARFAQETVRKHMAFYRRWRMLERVRRQVEAEDPHRGYKDRALLPDAPELDREWRLYTQTKAAETAFDRERRVAGKKVTSKSAPTPDRALG